MGLDKLGGGQARGGHAYKYIWKWGDTYDSRYSELRCVGSRDSRIKTDRHPKFARKKDARCSTQGLMQPQRLLPRRDNLARQSHGELDSRQVVGSTVSRLSRLTAVTYDC